VTTGRRNGKNPRPKGIPEGINPKKVRRLYNSFSPKEITGTIEALE
jgi:hypothetical protein